MPCWMVGDDARVSSGADILAATFESARLRSVEREVLADSGGDLV